MASSDASSSCWIACEDRVASRPFADSRFGPDPGVGIRFPSPFDRTRKRTDPPHPAPDEPEGRPYRLRPRFISYDGQNDVLRDVSFDVRPGERVGIVGATGAGKSTLINLLLRFYDVTRGRILIDGLDVRELDLRELRRLFSLVLQDVHLFSGTIAENIRLGELSITERR